MVYFIRCGRNVKIGRTTTERFEDRLRELQCGNPVELEVLGTIDGADSWLEAALHRQLARERVRGEWFPLSPHLIRAVAKGENVSEFVRDWKSCLDYIDAHRDGRPSVSRLFAALDIMDGVPASEHFGDEIKWARAGF